MPKTTPLKSKSDRRTMNTGTRRALHLEFRDALRARKRRRTLRAEINEALELSRLRVEQQDHAALSSLVRATDVKDPIHGWPIVTESGEEVEFSSSRDKARAKAKEINSTPVLTIERAMNDLGYFKLSKPGKTPETKWTRTV